MIREGVKKIININFFFFMFIAFVFQLFSLDSSTSPRILGYESGDLHLKGLVFLFIIITGELSKNVLQREKTSKRLEWFLGNGCSLHRLFISYSMIQYIASILVMAPSWIWILFKDKITWVPMINTSIQCFLLTLSINLYILQTKNMKKFHRISLKFIILYIFTMFLEFGMIHIIKDYRAVFLVSILFFLGILFSYSHISLEDVITSYY
ncbi:MAG: hypothetical protein Q4Q07_09945 [Tissierellia bacterium]|nr:hypothetical protein [Tissierellia bacterium]